MDFSDKVKYVRAKLLISQRQLASEIGVSMVTISRWETGKLKPQFLTEKRFEAYCDNKNIDFRSRQ